MNNVLKNLGAAWAVWAAFSLPANPAQADVVDEARFCANAEWSKLPVLAEGRVMPLGVRAAHLRKFIFNASACSQVPATELFCLLSFGKRSEIEAKHGCQLSLKIEHEKNAEIAGLPPGARSASFESLWLFKQQLAMAHEDLSARGAENSGQGVDLSNVLNRLAEMETLEKGENWKILGSDRAWLGVASVRASGGVADDWQSRISLQAKYLDATELASLWWESLYEKVRPFYLAILIGLVGFLLSLLSVRSPRFTAAAVVSLVLLLLIEIFGITARTMISGRAPVTNMYETVLWAGLGVFVLATVMGFRLKDRRIWAFGFAGNAICLFMMQFATTMLNPGIRPLVPVLRDNFWLSTHVTSVTFSYACFALSWLVSNFTILGWVSGRVGDQKAFLIRWNLVSRIAIQVGTVFLAAGIILGGVWADYSWGRFWGWDPKETWALIALLGYLALLHGRLAGWFREFGFALASAFGFLFVLMAWFGVNFILAAGLHSYGFSSGGATFLLTVFVSQIVILILGVVRSPVSAGTPASH